MENRTRNRASGFRLARVCLLEDARPRYDNAAAVSPPPRHLRDTAETPLKRNVHSAVGLADWSSNGSNVVVHPLHDGSGVRAESQKAEAHGLVLIDQFGARQDPGCFAMFLA